MRQNQDYAEGSVTFTIGDSKQNMTGTITLNSTAIAVIQVNGVPGRWSFNLNTFALFVQQFRAAVVASESLRQRQFRRAAMGLPFFVEE